MVLKETSRLSRMTRAQINKMAIEKSQQRFTMGPAKGGSGGQNERYI